MRDLEVPSGGGVGTARAIAKAYGVFASGGRELGLRAETIEALKAPAVPSRHGFYDECFRGPAKFSLGFMKPSEAFPFGHASAFGAPGAGGSMGYADPEAGIGYGYVTNRMGMDLQGDPRDVALRAAIPTDVSRGRGGGTRCEPTAVSPAAIATRTTRGTTAGRSPGTAGRAGTARRPRSRSGRSRSWPNIPITKQTPRNAHGHALARGARPIEAVVSPTSTQTAGAIRAARRRSTARSRRCRR